MARRPPWVVLMTQAAASAGRLVLEGALTTRTAEALCTTLRENIAHNPAVLIDCLAATEVDLSFIQLLVASRVSAAQSGKTVVLSASPDGALLTALTRAGFSVTQEAQSDTAPAFWFEGAG